MASPGKRRETDLMKLMMADYDVQMCNGESVGEFYVKFPGPKGTPYEGGVWKVHVELPDAYPYKSPSIGFINRLYHPNVDEMSGSVCLDVINQTWSPMYDLTNIFEVFLPQLLTYPNPTDPLNGEAAALQMREPDRYQAKVKEYVQKYARPEDFANAQGDAEDDSDDYSFSSTEEEEAAAAPKQPAAAQGAQAAGAGAQAGAGQGAQATRQTTTSSTSSSLVRKGVIYVRTATAHTHRVINYHSTVYSELGPRMLEDSPLSANRPIKGSVFHWRNPIDVRVLSGVRIQNSNLTVI